MDNKTKQKFTSELSRCAQEFNKPIVDELKRSIENIKAYYGLSNSELAELLGMSEVYLNTMFDNEGADSDIDLNTISLLTLLSNGRLSVLTDTPSGELYNKINRVIKDYKDATAPKTGTITDKIIKVLNMFGVTNEDELDNFLNTITNINGIIEDHDTCQPKNTTDKPSKEETVYVSPNGKFSNKTPESKTDNDDKVKAYYYDSQTMDEPEEFEFKVSLDQAIPSLLKLIKKIL